jgi:histidine triad (HIT) family protein
MNGCLFCKIVAKEIPASVVYEDDFSLAFLDIRPVNIGHTLLLPKEHYENIFDLSEELIAKLAVVSKKLAVAIKGGLVADGINITSNNNPAAGQLIFHAHTHIIPRYADDGFTHWQGKRGYNEGEAKEVAGKIKSNLT